jgi:hypothetical protein
MCSSVVKPQLINLVKINDTTLFYKFIKKIV